MKQLKIDGREVSLFTQWDEVPTWAGIEYLSNYAQQPLSEREALTWKQEIVFLFSNIPAEYKGKIPYLALLECYSIIHPLLITQIDTVPLDSFVLSGITYQCSPSAFDVDGTTLPMATATVDEMLEAMATHEKIMAQRTQVRTLAGEIYAGDITLWPTLIAMLYRPKGEAYDDTRVSERARLFRQMPFSTLMGCTFFLALHYSTSAITMQHSIKKEQMPPLPSEGMPTV